MFLIVVATFCSFRTGSWLTYSKKHNAGRSWHYAYRCLSDPLGWPDPCCGPQRMACLTGSSSPSWRVSTDLPPTPLRRLKFENSRLQGMNACYPHRQCMRSCTAGGTSVAICHDAHICLPHQIRTHNSKATGGCSASQLHYMSHRHGRHRVHLPHSWTEASLDTKRRLSLARSAFSHAKHIYHTS